MTGAFAMWVISLQWEDKITVLGWLGVFASGITILAWLLINRFFVLRQSVRQGG